nr:hypothetical protein [Tanacetum cinerariifolium]
MPSAVLGGNYPYSVLFPTKKLFPINPKIFGITTYRHQEENDDLLVYISPTSVETTKQSAKLDDAPNDVSNDVPISTLSEAYGKSDVPNDVPSGSDSPSPSPTPELDLPVSLWKVTTYRHQEENDDLLVYVSPTSVETTKQSAKVDDAPNDVSNDVPISTLSEAYGKSDVPSDAPSGSDLPSPSPTPELDLPVALWKGKHTCRYPVSAFVSYDGLSTSSRAFVANLDSILVLKTVGEALAHSGWRAAMIEEMNALEHNDLLDDAGQIEAKSCDEPMIQKLKLRSEDGRLLHNPEKYRRVVGKLNYLTITRPNIAFSVSVVSQFLTASRMSHWDAVTQILGYLKGTPRLSIIYANHGHHIAKGFTDADYAGCPNTSRSTTGYYVFVRGNLVSWKKAIYIATNPVYHERTKHIEVDCHFTSEKFKDGTITTPHIRTESQLADVLTKALPGTRINSICNKLGMIKIYAQLEGEC